MAEYIEREAAIAAIYDIQGPIHSREARVLRELPAADVVEVVRCKDCKAWICFMNNPDGTMFGNCKLCGNNFRNEDDFCSYGERKAVRGDA